MSEQTEDKHLSELERETVREAMRILGSRKSARKTQACRSNARIRWAKEAANKKRAERAKAESV